VASKFVAEHEAHQDLRALWGLKEALYKAVGLPGLHFAKDLLWESTPGPDGSGTAVFPGGQALWGRSDVDDQCVVWGLLPEPRHRLTAPFRWVITGAESSGKSTWASDLAHRLNVALVPEGAREWMVPGADYTADEVRTWGRKQILLESDLPQNDSAVVDTDTVNFDVWLQVRFGENWQPDDAWPVAMLDRWVAVLSPLETWEPDPLRETPDLADRLRIASLHAAAVEREAGGERVDWWEVAQSTVGAEIAATANQNRWPLLYICKAQGCPSESKG
jgi:nicotinamide riboside kinase